MIANDFNGTAAEHRFTEQLIALSSTYGMGLSADQARLCTRHVRIMLHWNRHVNLTRITDPIAIINKHLLDSLVPARVLPRDGFALDVGTGAGFPGIPIKITRPALRMVLLEAHHKKVSFLKTVLAELRLEGIWAVAGKWETFDLALDPTTGRGYTVITMRAVKLTGGPFAEFAAKALHPGGMFAYWSGPRTFSGRGAIQADLMGDKFTFLGSHGYDLPGSHSQRQLLVWQRNSD